MTMKELDDWLTATLQPEAWSSTDLAHNGFQVERLDSLVRRAAFAVDASLQSFERAVASDAQVLVVHHGLYWGKVKALTGEHYRRVKYLMDNDLALYASHLPLDAHPTLGNNAGMAQALNLQELQPFGIYRGRAIGFRGVLAVPQTLEQICDTLFHGRENALSILPFGPSKISTVGLVSGGATRETTEALELGLDLYVTGDADHTVYHNCLEGGLNLISGGHYATETWGVRLLAQELQRQTGLSTVFLDLPTGL